MSILDTLIIDRTQENVNRIKYLANKIKSGNATSEEIQEYMYPSKGAYNALDLNRVGQACSYLYGLIQDYGYILPDYVPLRTDWEMLDIPTQQEMSDYLNTVRAFKSLWNAITELPESMNRISYEDANNIESLLIEVNEQLEKVSAVFIRSGAWNAFSGTGFYIKN